MSTSAPSLRWRAAPSAAAFSSYTPGRTARGGPTVSDRLFDSSSRSNDRLSGRTVVQPGGAVTTICAMAGPRVRLVTVIVKWRGPPAAPSTGQTTSSGVTATSNGRVTNSGRRTSPVRWSRYRYTTSRDSVSGWPAIVSRTVICTGGGSNGNPRHAGGTLVQSYKAPASGRRRKYAWDRGASGATVTAKRRVATVPAGTGEPTGSSRSTFHPAGAPSSIVSSVTPASPAFHTLVSTWTRSPGITLPSSAKPSIATPAAAASASWSIVCCPESASPTSRRARPSNGAIASGRIGLSRARAESINAA